MLIRILRIPFLLLPFALAATLAQEPPTQTHAAQGTALSQTPRHSTLAVNGKPLGNPVPPREGEICIVCRRPVGNEGVVYIVNGQRVPVHTGACDVAFAKNPESYLAALRPRGAFLGSGGEELRPSLGWFLAGLYILLGLLFAALCAHRALSAGRNPVAWFAAGMVINVLGYLWLLTRPRQLAAAGVPSGLGKVATTYGPLPCPGCGASNHPAAGRCAACGNKLQSVVSSEVEKVGLRSH